ncbi:MAG: VOC family protein [Burkholderiaceae bacterium]|nr:VOC family protein [Burkholderiaceae bacterium]
MQTPLPLALDHTVINVHFELDRAQAIFESLGFSLTPRGRHSLGSINHLIVLADDYVEIVGLPTDTDVLRQEVLDSPVGIDGLVFQTTNADQTYQALTQAKRAIQPVQAFSRPVELDGASFAARFRTTRFESGTFPAGRVYFCQHLTPELVWRKEWQSHTNKVVRTAAFLIVSQDPTTEAKKYLEASGGTLNKGAHGEWRIQAKKYSLVLVSPAQYLECYGPLMNAHRTRKSFFGAIALQTTDLKAVKERLALTQQRFPEVVWREQPDRISVAIPDFNTLIDFVQ